MNSDGKIIGLDTEPWNNKKTTIYDNKYMAFIHAHFFCIKTIAKGNQKCFFLDI
jgi:hypothetical protein